MFFDICEQASKGEPSEYTIEREFTWTAVRVEGDEAWTILAEVIPIGPTLGIRPALIADGVLRNVDGKALALISNCELWIGADGSLVNVIFQATEEINAKAERTFSASSMFKPDGFIVRHTEQNVETEPDVLSGWRSKAILELLVGFVRVLVN